MTAKMMPKETQNGGRMLPARPLLPHRRSPTHSPTSSCNRSPRRTRATTTSSRISWRRRRNSQKSATAWFAVMLLPSLFCARPSLSLLSGFVTPFVGGSVVGELGGQKLRVPSLKPSLSGSRGKRVVVTMVHGKRNIIFNFPVELSIKSFKVQRLFIELPETATVASLKGNLLAHRLLVQNKQIHLLQATPKHSQSPHILSPQMGIQISRPRVLQLKTCSTFVEHVLVSDL